MLCDFLLNRIYSFFVNSIFLIKYIIFIVAKIGKVTKCYLIWYFVLLAYKFECSDQMFHQIS